MDERFRRRVLARAAWLGIPQQQQLAALLAMDESTLSRALRAENPRGKTIERIAKALGLTADELLGDDEAVVVRPHPAIVVAGLDPVAQIRSWLEAAGSSP